MIIQTERPNVQLMAIVGACIAATLFVLGWAVIGIVASILEGSPFYGEVWGVLGFLLVVFSFGLVIALLTAFPLGWLYGRLILRLARPSIGTAALTGALTGATLIAVVSMLGSGGFRENWQPASLFAVLGAISGALAFCLVMRRKQNELSS